MTDEPVACRWFISGRVQGVGFRWYVQRSADEHGIHGWVRNLPDGRVEAVGKGDPDSMAEFHAALGRGPRLSHVENVDKRDIPHENVTDKRFYIK